VDKFDWLLKIRLLLGDDDVVRWVLVNVNWCDGWL
jgi:hypothetical protein